MVALSVVSAEASILDEIIRDRAIRVAYQPIVELDSDRLMGWEALVSGPAGSALELRDRLFSVAARVGRIGELDHCCRAAAIAGAIVAGLGRGQELFVSVEPSESGVAVPTFLERSWGDAQSLRATAEITERALIAAPTELIALIDMYRCLGWGIAIDDVTGHPRALALMPLIQPDVIKLDATFVQHPVTRERARVIHAVAAEAERSGAALLAKGIDDAEQAQTARSLGATLGQGRYLGRPGVLRPEVESQNRGRARVSVDLGLGTPFEHLLERRGARLGTKAQLLQISRALEDQARLQGESAVLLSAFQDGTHFQASTRARYAQIAQEVGLVGVLAHDLDSEPAPGVIGLALEAGDSLCREWDVIVVGSHFAGALAARDLGDNATDSFRRFEYIVTYDRQYVVAAAVRLMRRIARRHR